MDEEKELFLGEVKSGNEEEDTEEKKKRPHFWKGFAAGSGAMFLVAGAVFCVTNGVVDRLFYPENAGNLSLSGLKTSRKLSELSNVINYYYLNDIDEEQVEDWMYKGVMAGLEDPYADYYSEEELNSLKESTSGSYKGIGAVMTQDKDTGEISVVRCYENTPAAESGLLPGDIVTKYNGEDTSGLDLTEIVNEIKTGENDEITFTIKREGESEEKEITLTRRAVDIPTVTSEMLENNIGYLEISEFDTVTLEQFQEAKASLGSQGMEKLIVDLRNNPGGNLSTVVDILREILPEGLIVYTEDRYGNRTEYSCDGDRELEIPLAVLINGDSASASEIFAGAVKDYGIGILVGTTTFGKGIVQRIVELSDGTAVKLTIAKYYTPKGNNIHDKGIEPDVEVELEEGLEQQITIPKDQDNQLQKAIEILEEE